MLHEIDGFRYDAALIDGCGVLGLPNGESGTPPLSNLSRR